MAFWMAAVISVVPSHAALQSTVSVVLGAAWDVVETMAKARVRRRFRLPLGGVETHISEARCGAPSLVVIRAVPIISPPLRGGQAPGRGGGGGGTGWVGSRL